ncbi:MAG: HD domain-containing protein [Chloroflexota bacterium]
MEQKADNPVKLLQGQGTLPIVEAYFELCQLKQLFRQGWLRRGVTRERCESIAEHSFGVALLALWLAQAYFPELDTSKVVQMALLHDFGEVYAGDIIPGDPVSAEEKRQREAASVAQVFGKLPGGEAYRCLWEEFETGQSPEARFVRQIDRLEMGLQAGVYHAQGFAHMDEFFTSAAQALSEPRLSELLEAVRTVR